MNVKLRVISVGVLFFTGHMLMAQKKKADTTTKTKDIEEVVLVGGVKLDPAVKLGSYTVVSKANFESTPVASVDEVLNGRVAGLTFSTNGGDPGSTNLITIRGVGSLIGTPNPLYVIDGVIVGKGSDNAQVMESWNPLASIDPNSIEKVAVLKDASATALYGARGANGVVVITTKRGRYNQKTRFNFSSDMSRQDIAFDKQKYMNASEYLQWGGQMYVNNGQFDNLSDAIAHFASGNISKYDGVTNENWQKRVQRSSSTVNTYNFSATGGGENTSFRVGGSYYENLPLVLNSNFNRLSTSVALDHKIAEKFSLGFNANFTNVERKTYNDGGAYRNPWLTNWYIAPIYPALNPDGSYNQTNLGTGNNNFNPMAIQNMDLMKGSIRTFVSSINAEYQFAKGFYVNTLYGVQYQTLDEKQYWDPRIGDGLNFNGYIYQARTSAFDWNWTNSISYRTVLNDKHDIQAYIGNEYQEHKYFTLIAQVTQLSQPLPYLAFGTNYLQPGEDRLKWTQISYFSRLNYTFDKKYSLSGQIRRDGNSTVGDKKFGNFWSVAGSWDVKGESFAPKIFNQLTLRANYGELGNIPYADQWYTQYNQYALVTPTALYASETGAVISTPGNRNLTWEVSKQFNLGLDFSILNNVISGSVDVYNRKTVSAIYDLPIVPTVGGPNTLKENIGTLLNRGVEVNLGVKPINNENFKWSIDGNFAYNKNTVEELKGQENQIILSGVSNSMRATSEGHLLGEYYTYLWAGVDPTTGAGLFWTDETRTETTTNRSLAKRVWQGKTPFPLYTAGIKNDFKYKNLTLSLFFTGQFEFTVHNRWTNYIMGDGSAINNQLTDALYDSWTPSNPNASNPIQLPNNPSNASGPSTRWMRDGDHIRLKEAKLSYSFGSVLKDAVNIDNLTVYLRGVNLWLYTFDKNLTFDPEANSNAAGASWEGKGLYDYTSPLMRSISFGISLDF